MNQKEYDGPGTASMVGKVLIDTMNFTKDALSAKCKHFVYDGVYATSEERKGNRGGLSLKKHFADYLGRDDDTINRQHDLAHNMQLAYSDGFNKKVGRGKLILDALKAM